MSLKRREQLVDHVLETQPQLRAFVRESPDRLDMIAGSWDLLAYSFARGFEALWDKARTDYSGLLLRPVLLLWRQSIELSLKAAITEIAGELDGKPGHDLDALFTQLLRVRANCGFCDDDVLAPNVREMIALVQSLDPFADRFRYPSTRGEKLFQGIDADLDELFQAHWIIVTYCEGAAIEAEQSRSYSADYTA